MIKLYLLVLLMVAILQLSEAQILLDDLGNSSKKAIEMKEYEKDPSAEAVFTKDVGVSFFQLTDEGFEIVFQRECEIKIFSKAGIKYAEFAIPYYVDKNGTEEITYLKGNTFNLENGFIERTALDVKKTYTEKISDHLSERKFAMPNVKEGSVINVSYEIRSSFLFGFRDWNFQYKIPVIYSEYNAKMIPFYGYSFILQGATKLDEFNNSFEDALERSFNGMKYKDRVYHFVLKDIPAFKDESYITSINDYRIKLNFQLSEILHKDGTHEQIMTTWPKLSADLQEDESFGKYLKSSIRRCKETTDTMKLGSKTELEKAMIIDRFVKSNFNWNNISSKYATSSIKDFLNKKTGNSADINLFLIAMLNAAGIEANPVILSTRANGKIYDDYPFVNFFNYVIAMAQINNKTCLLDATEPFCNFNEIPIRCFNDKGLVIQKKEVKWIKWANKTPSYTEYNFSLKLNSTNDSINENCELVTSGYDAVKYRNKYTSSYKDLKAELIGENALNEDSLTAINLSSTEKSFEILYKVKKQIEKVEDKIIIAPFCNSTITENPLKQPTRTYPVDLIYKITDRYRSTIEIPSGYKLLSKPDNLNFEDNLIKISFMTDIQENNKINVSGSYKFKNDIYESSDYPMLKDDFKKIVDKFNEKIVLVKL